MEVRGCCSPEVCALLVSRNSARGGGARGGSVVGEEEEQEEESLVRESCANFMCAQDVLSAVFCKIFPERSDLAKLHEIPQNFPRTERAKFVEIPQNFPRPERAKFVENL